MWKLTETARTYHHLQSSYMRREKKENTKDYVMILKLFNQKSSDTIHGNKGLGKGNQLCCRGFRHAECEMTMTRQSKDALENSPRHGDGGRVDPGMSVSAVK